MTLWIDLQECHVKVKVSILLLLTMDYEAVSTCTRYVIPCYRWTMKQLVHVLDISYLVLHTALSFLFH